MIKLMLMGYGRHGKDTVADILRSDYGLKIANSSWFAAENAVFPTMQKRYGYKDVQSCYDDRHAHRSEWFDLIKAYNTPDLARMSREIFAENNVYVGIRNAYEYFAAREEGIFDFSIWVDARMRVSNIEPDSSCTVDPMMCDYILDNNHNIEFTITHLAKIMLHSGAIKLID